MYKSFKYRIYPNKEQRILIAKTFGCCRFVYNKILEHKKEVYENNGITLSRFDCINYCSQVLKKDYEWLKEVDSVALVNTVSDLDDAYKHFFREHKGYPKFKSRNNRHCSYTTTTSNKNSMVDFENSKIKVPKVGFIKAVIYKQFKGNIRKVTISQTPSGRYFASVLVETEHSEMKHNNKQIGVVFGTENICTTSDGKVYKNPKSLEKHEKRLILLQQSLSKKQKGSKNYEKARIKLAKCHEKIANTRKYHLHKISHDIVKNNQVIFIPNLDIKSTLQETNNAKELWDASLGEFERQLTYKAQWNNCKLITVNSNLCDTDLANEKQAAKSILNIGLTENM